MAFGWAVAAALLAKFAADFSSGMSVAVAAPFALLALAALSVSAATAFARSGRMAVGNGTTGLFLAAIPLAFIASSLDCMGLTLWGCSPGCSLIKLLLIPSMAGLALGYYFTRRPRLLTVALAISFLSLIPHCLCYNAANGWWIDRVGASPVCYVWGFVVTLLSVGALRAESFVFSSLAIISAIIAGAGAFFVGHHFFHFPW